MWKINALGLWSRFNLRKPGVILQELGVLMSRINGDFVPKNGKIISENTMLN